MLMKSGLVWVQSFCIAVLLTGQSTSAASLTKYELDLPGDLACEDLELPALPTHALAERTVVQIYDRDRQLVMQPLQTYPWKRNIWVGSYTLTPHRSADHREVRAKYGHLLPNQHSIVIDMLRTLNRIGFETEETAVLFRAATHWDLTKLSAITTPSATLGMDGVVGISQTNMTMVLYYEETAQDLSDIAYNRMYIEIPEDVISGNPVFAVLKIDDNAIEHAIAFVRIAPETGETRRRMVRALNVLFGNLQSGYGFADFQGAPAWTGLTGWSREELCHLARTYTTSP
jgi:hypothetical protein